MMASTVTTNSRGFPLRGLCEMPHQVGSGHMVLGLKGLENVRDREEGPGHG